MNEIAQERLHLGTVKRLIEQGVALVAEQEQHLQDLQKDGRPTEAAERTLENLKGAVQALRYTQTVIERALKGVRAGKLHNVG